MVTDKIIKYYEDCHSDYVNFWKINKNLGLHFGFYDEKHRSHNKAVINMNRVMAEISSLKDGDMVLDIGCGIGGSLIWLAQKFDIKGTGINITKTQINIGNQLIEKYNLKNKIKFYERNFLDTKFSSNSFDIVWGLGSTCYAEDKKELLIEIKRILKKGGKLIISEAFKKDNLSNKDQENLKEKWLKNWAVPDIAGEQEFTEYLQSLNFKNIKFVDITENVRPSLRRLYLASFYAYPIRRILELSGLTSKTKKENISASYYQYKFLKRGFWKYGIFYAEK